VYNGQLPVTGFSGLVYAVVGLLLLAVALVAGLFRMAFRR